MLSQLLHPHEFLLHRLHDSALLQTEPPLVGACLLIIRFYLIEYLSGTLMATVCLQRLEPLKPSTPVHYRLRKVEDLDVGWFAKVGSHELCV